MSLSFKLSALPALLAVLFFVAAELRFVLGGGSASPSRHRAPLPADGGAEAAQRPSIAAASYAGERLLFSDDFDELDLSVWQHELTMGGGGNWEFEYYTNNRSNSFVDGSVLYLRPTLTRELIGEANVQNGYTMDMWGSSPADLCTGNSFYGCERTSGAGGNIINPIQSARIRTADSINVKYGRVEVSAKLPIGDWLWPAIWLVPRYNSYGMWPASGEVDIVESRGNGVDYPAGGHNYVASTLHWGPSFSEDPWPLTHANYSLPSNQSFHDSFHVFGVKWDASGLYTYVDSDANRVLSVDFTEQSFWQRGGWANSSWANPWRGRNNSAPFDQSFYLVLNVAVGGVAGYFPDGVAGKPWKNTDGNSVNEFYAAIDRWLPTWGVDTNQPAMAVDWVKIYQ